MDVSTAIFWALCALEDAMASNDNAGFHRLRFTQAYHELRRLNRRERRRARKARKNSVMYKTAGRRPWNVQMIGNGAEDEPHPWEPLTEPWNNTWDRDGRSWVNRNYSAAVDRRAGCLREPSGFITISRVADFYRAMHKTFDKYGELFERIGDD